MQWQEPRVLSKLSTWSFKTSPYRRAKVPVSAGQDNCYFCICAVSDFYYCLKLPMTRAAVVLAEKQFLTPASNKHLKAVITGVENH